MPRIKKRAVRLTGHSIPNEFIYPSGNRLKRQTESATRTRALNVAVKNNFIEQPPFLSTKIKREKKKEKRNEEICDSTKSDKK